MSIWPGYTTAVHEFEDGLYLVIDVAHKVLRSETCYDMIADIQNRLRNDPGAVRQEVYNAMVGNIVLTKYNNRTYKIDDIMWEQNPMSEFQYKNEMITYKDYYK